jgi:hypothetical protein
LGFWDVDGMLRRMSSHTLTEWMAYYNLEPFGAELLDLHFARLNTTIIDVKRKRNSSPTDPQKFRLWKKIANFNPQEYYEQLKTALTFKKWDDE